MALDLGISFPSEAESLRKQWEAEKHLTPEQRLLAVVDALTAAEALSNAGGLRQAQLKYQATLEEDWRERMKEFIKKHVIS
jgi:hypothetical protein